MIEIDVQENDHHTVVSPKGELDAFSVGRLRERLADLPGASRLVIDLSEVPFLDSAGIGALIGAIRKSRDEGGAVTVACTRENVLRLLHTAGFDRIVPVASDLETAVAALEQPGDDGDGLKG